MAERLVSLQAVKDWLGITNPASDKGLTRIIKAASQFALSAMNRDGFAPADYVQNFKGNGKSTTLLRNWPVISVSAVGSAGSSIVPSVQSGGLYGSGYVIGDPRGGPQSIELYGSCFHGQCQVSYRAGWETAEQYTIEGDDGDPASALTFAPIDQVWTIDNGVTGPDGTAWTLVKSDPATTQYTCDEWGNYGFSSDDIDKMVTLNYAYVPYDLSQGVLDMIGLWWKRKDRIGVLSKTLAGQETVTFDKSSMTDMTSTAFQQYTNVVPI